MKTYHDLVTANDKIDADSDALFEMANLAGRDTGLPFVVWIAPRGHARHDVRIKVSPGHRAVPSEMISVAIRPEVRVVTGSMKNSDLALLRKWVALNRNVLIRYWDGDIESTKEALLAIRSI